MEEFFAIILIDNTEVSLRIYKIDEKKWQLSHFNTHNLLDNKAKKITAYAFAEVIANFFSATYAQKVVEWRICARKNTKEIISDVALTIGFPIELIEQKREQELICKGIFTELW